MCARTKPRRHLPYGLLKPLPIPVAPWKSISMDFVGPLPQCIEYDMILVVVDRLTKLAHFIPTHSKLNSVALSHLFITNVVRIHGYPTTVVSDRGVLFTSKFWEDFSHACGIKLLLSTAHHQQTNGQSERVIQCLKQYLRLYINYKQDDWVDHLALAEFAYNNSVHASIGMSPFKATYGYDFSLGQAVESYGSGETLRSGGETVNRLHEVHEQLKQYLVKAQERQKRFADKHRCDMPKFVVGTKVWLQTSHLHSDRPNKSLDYKFIGPFEITEQVNELSFRLELPETMKCHDVFHVSLLEPFVENQIAGRTVEPPAPLSIEEDGDVHQEFEVEHILNKRVRNKRVQYLVHWKGYGIKDRTWEPLQNLTNCRKLISEYERHEAARKDVPSRH
jgi:hypothetical protein